MAKAGNKVFSLHVGAAAAAALGLGMVLGGCALSGPDSGASRAGSGLDMVGGTRRAVERDVEAPEVFSMEEAGLWDGRPSLGGVWVAHPGVQNPERVLIRNAQTGETVIGALFRRERENPGPQFQISSEAANALEILPGAPTTIRVTALRLEQIEIEPAPAAARTGDEARGETVAAAGAEEAAPPSAGPGAPAGQVEIVAAGGAEQAPRRGLLGGLFSRRTPEPDAQPAIAETTLAPAPAEGPVTFPQQTAVAVAAVAPQPPAQERRGLLGLFRRSSTAPEAVPETTLIPLPPEASTTPLTASLAPATTPSAAPVGVQGGLERPFVQIGIFSVESNATNARSQMQAAGLSAEIRRGRANERDFWRVVVGPASDPAARGQILERVRALGFADAYAVVR